VKQKQIQPKQGTGNGETQKNTKKDLQAPDISEVTRRAEELTRDKRANGGCCGEW
jgi:hypothetical protein